MSVIKIVLIFVQQQKLLFVLRLIWCRDRVNRSGRGNVDWRWRRWDENAQQLLKRDIFPIAILVLNAKPELISVVSFLPNRVRWRQYTVHHAYEQPESAKAFPHAPTNQRVSLCMATYTSAAYGRDSIEPTQHACIRVYSNSGQSFERAGRSLSSAILAGTS